MEEEKWEKIPGFDGAYEISDQGRVLSWKKYPYKHKYFRGKNKSNGKILKLALTKYLHVNLINDGVVKTIRVHRLVAEAFIPNPENKPCINHKNGIRTDCRAANLEWCTHQENTDHAIENGLFNPRLLARGKGEDCISSKLKAEEVISIREEYGNKTQQEIADKYGVSRETISHIINRRTWSHI